ncbi:MAG: peptidoglycan -binding protein [Paracoccaceae bacterium]
MALGRRRDSSMIWPGFVDAVTTLLMVMIFILTIFTVMQSVLRDEVTSKTNELSALNQQIAGLADALGLEQKKTADLTAAGQQQEGQIADLTGQLAARQGQLDAANARLASFEAQVASLLAERDSARGQVTELTASVAALDAAQKKLITDKEALDLALAKARSEIDAGAEAARLAAARREALEALIADLKTQAADRDSNLAAVQGQLDTAQARLSDEEKARLADQAALAALQDKLRSSDTELTAMTLALEEQRRKAEETLTLLAAADAARADAANKGQETAGLLDAARSVLSQKDRELVDSAKKLALLNQQIAALRSQLGTLQGVLDASSAKDAEAKVQIDSLGTQLNAALAQVASEQKKRAEMEEAERKRLEAEKQDLERFRSEFFGQLSQLLAGREGVRVVGDRFVFSSEVLFAPGAADLLPEGKAQIAGVVQTLNEIAADIPPGIDWIIRVDGHTDNVPLSGLGEFKDNWQLSSARALSVVRYMQDDLGFPPNRLAATGFGEYRPVAEGDTPEARAQNRRIELKLTER